MEEYIAKGPFNEVHADDKRLLWYLPHHPVLKKPGKTRVVFDCTAKYRGTSLNDQLLTGPDLTNTIVGVLMRLCEEQVALLADIECMFHQVRVPPDNQDAFRLLWWPGGDLNQQPVDYRMKVHLFGATSSPSSTSHWKGQQKTTKANSRNKWSGQSKGTFTSMTASSRLNLQKTLWNLYIS